MARGIRCVTATSCTRRVRMPSAQVTSSTTTSSPKTAAATTTATTTAPATAPTTTTTDRGARLGYIPALDGLRALAVIAVLIYHADMGWFRGGFLGVDVFFVLSGYLITCLLLADWRNTGGIGLRRFWLRRARRLLPALFVMLAVTCAYTAVFVPHEAAKLRSDVFAALGYVTNWYLVFRHQSYFASSGRPPMVQHLWSLAVEEQFYLVWPLAFSAALLLFRRQRRGRRRPRQYRGRLALAILGAAAVSALLMAVLYHPYTDPSRVYYGTDTHASGLLIGAALAVVWAPWRLSPKTGRGASTVVNGVGLAALIALLWCFQNVSEFDTGLYRGGYPLIALVTAVVIAMAVHPVARLSGVILGNAPMRWIGERSYGIYLWHWPVYQVTRPGLDVPLTGYPLFALRVAITVGIAALSFRFVEAPIRQGALGRWFKTLRYLPAPQRKRRLGRLSVVTTGLTASLVLVGFGLAAAQPAPKPPGFSKAAVHIQVTTTTTSPATTAPATTTPPTTAPASAAPPAPAPAPAPLPAAATQARITAIGDSVMLGAQSALREVMPNIQIDAAVSRQFSNALQVARMLHDAGQLGDEVVLHLGTNGTINPDQFDQMMQILSGVRRVVVVNASVPRGWEQEVNDTIAAGVKRYPNAVVLDWHTIAYPHSDWFVEDQVHLNSTGQHAYAQLIAQNL